MFLETALPRTNDILLITTHHLALACLLLLKSDKSLPKLRNISLYNNPLWSMLCNMPVGPTDMARDEIDDVWPTFGFQVAKKYM